MSTDTSDGDTFFGQLADLLSHDHRVTRSTMMGFPCLRVDGRFFACVELATGNLIIKLSAERVQELVRTGSGRPFTPNGRVFKEWVACPASGRDHWTDLLDEARIYVDRAPPG